MTPKNYPRPLEVFGEHAAMRVSAEAAVGSELFLKEGSRGSTATKTFRNVIHQLKEDVRSWYELHRRSGATNVVVWAIYLELLLMLVLLVLLPFDTVQVGGRYRLIKPLNFTMSMSHLQIRSLPGSLRARTSLRTSLDRVTRGLAENAVSTFREN